MNNIIINADDFGLSTEVNKAIITCFKKGIISHTTAMANMPDIYEAINLAKDNNIMSNIGLHFNIIEGRPLSKSILSCKRLCDSNGLFAYKRNSIFFFTKEERNAIREEFDEQLKLLLKLGVNVTHMDSHQHVHTELPIYFIIRGRLKKSPIKTIRISRNVLVRNIIKPYKFLFNKLLRLEGFKTTKYMGVYCNENKTEYENIELMCHPVLKNGKIMDSVLGTEINSKNYRNLKTFKDIL